MYKLLDRIFCWQWWPVLKWPCGAFIFWLVLFIIWKEKTVKNYDEKFLNSSQEWISDNLMVIKYLVPSGANTDNPLLPPVKTH